MEAPSRTSAWGRRLLERVTPDWQPLAPILDEMIAIIPPGPASRRYEKIKERQVEQRTGTGPTRPVPSDTEKQHMGARQMARDAIASQRKAGRVETETFDGVEHVRALVVTCTNCGHPQDPSRPATASSRPSSGRARLAEVIPLMDRKSREQWRRQRAQ